MVAGWLVVPSGLLMLALSAWYGVTQYSATNAPAPAPATARLRGPHHCDCALPASLRVMRMLHHVFPPPLQHRMGGDEGVPDLSQLSTAELQTLLGLPEDLIPTEQEIAELQALLEENGVPLSVLMQAGEQNKANEEALIQQEAADDPHGAAMEDPHAAMEDIHVPMEDPHAAMEDTHAAPAAPAAPPPPPPDPVVEHVEAPAPPPIPPNPVVPPSMAAGHFGVPFSQAAMDAAHDVFEGADVPIAAVSNPFPQNPFPADYADYGQQFLGAGAFPLSPVSYYHPVRTFKFRLFVPTFREFFGFQFASQTIVEIYVAKKPGANQFTGIPDAFFEKKYWNILFEVDGNKVISTMPTVLADTPAARTSPGKQDIQADPEYIPEATQYHEKTNAYGYDSGEYGYESGVSESDEYGHGSDDYEHESDDYGHDSAEYGYRSDGYEYDSVGNGHDSDSYGYGSDYYSDDQFSHRSNMPDAFRRRTNQTPVNAHRGAPTNANRRPGASANRRGAQTATNRRGAQTATNRRAAQTATNRRGAPAATNRRGAQTATNRRGAQTATNRRGAPAATNRRGAPAGAKRRTPAISKRKLPPNSKRRNSYKPTNRIPARTRQSPPTSKRRNPYAPNNKAPARTRQSPLNSNRRTASTSHRATPARRQQQSRLVSAPGRRNNSPPPTPAGWHPPASTLYRPNWPESVAADYEDSELRREAQRRLLKHKAKHGYMRRMSPARYTAWQRERTK